jgi:hypothetical protein
MRYPSGSSVRTIDQECESEWKRLRSVPRLLRQNIAHDELGNERALGYPDMEGPADATSWRAKSIRLAFHSATRHFATVWMPRHPRRLPPIAVNRLDIRNAITQQSRYDMPSNAQ